MFNAPGFVGCRIVSDGSIGTIRFIGTLPNSDGLWYGVEWDDPERGKHDGTYNGVRYFETCSPKSGSFIRLRKIDFGVSLWSAIETRYGEKLTDEVEASGVALRKMNLKGQQENENVDRDVYIATNEKLNGTRKRVEVVGLGKLERQRTFQRLTQISLRGARVNLLPFPVGAECEASENRNDLRSSGAGQNGLVLTERGANRDRSRRSESCDSDIERFERYASLNLINVRVLDLSSNLFHSWSQVMRIARSLPTLTELIISDSRLAFLRMTNLPQNLASLHQGSAFRNPAHKSISNRNDALMREYEEAEGAFTLDSVHKSFARIENVHLKSCNLRWCDVLRVASYFPSLREMHACANRISSADFTSSESDNCSTLRDGLESGFESQSSCESDVAADPLDLNAIFGKLEFLCLEDNPIGDSSVFDVLGPIRSLRTLVLRRVGLGALRLQSGRFPSLNTLNLMGNNIADWRDVDELNKIQALRDLRLAENPIMSVTPVASNSTPGATQSTVPLQQQIAVARLPRVTRLNGIEIDSEERKASERDYIRFYADAYVQAARDPAAADVFCSNHPRFADLLAAFPDLSDRCTRAITPSASNKSTNSQLVSITFRLDAQKVPNGALNEVTRSVPRTMAVDKLKALAQRLLRLRTGSLRLSYAHASKASERIYLDNELRTLAYYDVTQDGTVIFVTF